MFRRLILLAALVGLAPSAAAEEISSGMADRTRYDGQPYKTITVAPGDAAACRETCRGDLRCYAWDYRRARAGESSSLCELFERAPTLVWDDDYISGEVSRSQPAPDPDEHVTPMTPGDNRPPPPASGPSAGPDQSAGLWSQYTMNEEMEASGGAYSSWTYTGKGDGGLTRCATACAGDGKCRAFVVRSDAELAPPPQVMCELKSSPGSLLRNPSATTGVKH